MKKLKILMHQFLVFAVSNDTVPFINNDDEWYLRYSVNASKDFAHMECQLGLSQMNDSDRLPQIFFGILKIIKKRNLNIIPLSETGSPFPEFPIAMSR